MITELSKNEKLQKHRIILSQHTNCLCKWLAHLNFDMITAAMFIFFSKIPKYMQAQNNSPSYLMGWPVWTANRWKWASPRTKLAWDGESRLARFLVIIDFRANYESIENAEYTYGLFGYSKKTHLSGLLTILLRLYQWLSQNNQNYQKSFVFRVKKS